LVETGFEINTAPASGDLYVQQIAQICDAIKQQKGKIDTRCGLHVHVDASNFDYYDMRKLMLFYAKIENALFSMVARDRRNSHFCAPCGDRLVRDIERHRSPKDNRKKVIENVYGQEVSVTRIRHEKRHAARYSALNLHSVLYRGTVECRMHHGTINKTHITNWGILWASILDFVYNNTEKEIKALDKDGMTLLQEISPSKEVKEWIAERTKWFSNHNRE